MLVAFKVPFEFANCFPFDSGSPPPYSIFMVLARYRQPPTHVIVERSSAAGHAVRQYE